MILKDFSKQDANLILELINKSLSCASEADIRKLITDLRYLITYDFALCGLAKMDNCGMITSYDVINISYPAEWLDLYIRRKYHKLDPIVKENFARFTLQYWDHTYKVNSPPREFLCVARDFGLIDGYTHGMRNLKGNEGSLFSIAGKYLKQDIYAEAILQHIMPHLHQTLGRMINHQNEKSKSVLLISQREREVLNWVKEGKNSWDISVILGISERTVNFHVNNIKLKLNAVSRTHAVAIAIEWGLIDVA